MTGLVGLLYADPGNLRTPLIDWPSVKNLILTGGDLDQYVIGKTVTGRRLNARGSLNCSDTEILARTRPTTSEAKSWLVGTAENFEIWWARDDRASVVSGA